VDAFSRPLPPSFFLKLWRARKDTFSGTFGFRKSFKETCREQPRVRVRAQRESPLTLLLPRYDRCPWRNPVHQAVHKMVVWSRRGSRSGHTTAQTHRRVDRSVRKRAGDHSTVSFVRLCLPDMCTSDLWRLVCPNRRTWTRYSCWLPGHARRHSVQDTCTPRTRARTHPPHYNGVFRKRCPDTVHCNRNARVWCWPLSHWACHRSCTRPCRTMHRCAHDHRCMLHAVEIGLPPVPHALAAHVAPVHARVQLHAYTPPPSARGVAPF
jgi:hypothetical protein